MVADASKRVWYNEIERDAFIESHCRTCFQPQEAAKRVTGNGVGCPHLLRAADNKLPKAWTKKRNAVMGDTYKCADELKKPPVNRRGKTIDETPGMFEAPVAELGFVPVEGWPSAADFGRKQAKGDEHQ